MARAALLFAVTSAVVWAATAWGPPTALADLPRALRGQPIVDVRIEGEPGVTMDPGELELPEGARLGRTLVRALIARLLDSGRWAEVQVFAEAVAADDSGVSGVRLVVRLSARWHLARITVLGNDVLDDEDALRAMQIRSGAEIKREELNEVRQALQSAYVERGYEGVRIEFELRDTDDPSRKALVVRITEGQPTVIVGVEYDGTPPPRAARVRRALGFSAGDVYDRRDVDEGLRDGLDALRERRWYAARLGPIRVERVAEDGPDGQVGVRLHIRSVPGPRYRVVVHDPYPLTREAVEEVLSVGDERLSPAAAQAMAVRVKDLYARRGHPDAEVDVRRVPGRREGEALLVVRVNAGPQLRVLRTEFPGAAHFPDALLREQVRGFLVDGVDMDGIAESVDDYTADVLLEGVRHGRETPRPLRVSEIFYAPAYDAAVDHIARLYENAGYLHAQVGPVELERWERGRAIVRIPIVEGPQAHVYELRFVGNENLGDETLLEVSELERGMPFSRQLIEEARRRVQNAYREEGYLYARVTPSVRYSGDRTRAEVTLEVVEVFPVVVGEIRIEGARRTSETILRNLVRMEPGARFRPSDVRRTQEALMGLGVFSSVTVEPADATLPERVKPVVINVSERASQMLDFRAGVSTAEGVRGGFEYGYRNLFGWAIGLTLRVQLANQFFLIDDQLEESFRSLSLADRLERRITLGIVLPYLPGLANTRASLSVTHQRENERAFGLDSNQLDLTFTNRPVRWATLTFSTGIESNNVEPYENVTDAAFEALLADPRLRALLLVPRGRSTLVAAEVTASIDRRDNPFDPSRGFFTSMTVEWARSLRTETVRIGGEDERFFSHHLRAEFTLSGYIPLGPVTLALQGRVGRVFHLEDRSETYPNRQFFVGGVDSVRGYRQDAMVPQEFVDENATDVIAPGGDVFMVTRAELRFPIVGIFYGGAFADFGNVWRTAGNLNPLELRPTAGLGIRLATPVGPIAFDYGFLLARREGVNNEGLGSFHFSIGLF